MSLISSKVSEAQKLRSSKGDSIKSNSSSSAKQHSGKDSSFVPKALLITAAGISLAGGMAWRYQASLKTKGIHHLGKFLEKNPEKGHTMLTQAGHLEWKTTQKHRKSLESGKNAPKTLLDKGYLALQHHPKLLNKAMSLENTAQNLLRRVWQAPNTNKVVTKVTSQIGTYIANNPEATLKNGTEVMTHLVHNPEGSHLIRELHKSYPALKKLQSIVPEVPKDKIPLETQVDNLSTKILSNTMKATSWHRDPLEYLSTRAVRDTTMVAQEIKYLLSWMSRLKR
jgi:hypothetical protein